MGYCVKKCGSSSAGTVPAMTSRGIPFSPIKKLDGMHTTGSSHRATLSTIHTIYHKCVIISSYCPVRLTKKLEERREQRKTGEEENVIKKEIERRKVGKDMQDFKRKQEEEKTKRLLEERNREKAEEKAARERVKQQIALVRSSFSLHVFFGYFSVGGARSTIARIQFRLPDGSSFTNQFPSQSRLQEARNFAAQEVGNRYGNFSLATMFPRREFTSEDLDKTLLELELAPSASIVVLPSGRPANAVVQSSGGSIWAVLGTLLYPLLAVWRFLSSFLFATPPPPGAASRGPAHQSNSYTNSASASDKAKRWAAELIIVFCLWPIWPYIFKNSGHIEQPICLNTRLKRYSILKRVS
ncbi:UBX domain-containing protein 4 [Morone saxatilis]|uniref:UBX domain-containing protein 4 n=1 Tax=Morone saxatilis TaxID=34816 RepID=UPI0015E2216E|nr:UBX domain-containing protein 4 [Morone saxatilis]